MKNTINQLYEQAISEIQSGSNTSKDKALTVALSTIILEAKDPLEILGDIYLDFINYEKEIKKGNLDNFLDFFSTDIENTRERNRIMLEAAIYSNQKENAISMIASYRLVKEHKLEEGLEKYVKLKKIKK